MQKRQKEVGDELYKAYQWCRLELIEHLNRDKGKILDCAARQVTHRALRRCNFDPYIAVFVSQLCCRLYASLMA